MARSDARRLISQARTAMAAGQPALADTVGWNEAIIRVHTDAMLAAIAGTRRGSSSPEVNYLFYGDYGAVIDLLRRVPVDALFPISDSPMVESLFPLRTREARNATRAALAVQRELAPAHFLKGWLAYHPGDSATARAEAGLAAALAPTDAFYQAALARLIALDSGSQPLPHTPLTADYAGLSGFALLACSLGCAILRTIAKPIAKEQPRGSGQPEARPRQGAPWQVAVWLQRPPRLIPRAAFVFCRLALRPFLTEVGHRLNGAKVSGSCSGRWSNQCMADSQNALLDNVIPDDPEDWGGAGILD